MACLVVLAAGIATAPLGSLASRGLLAALVLAVLGLARPRPRWLARRLGPPLVGLAALLLPLVLVSSAERSAEIVARAVGAAVVAAAVASTLALAELGPALAALGVPRALSSAVHALLWQLEHVGAEGRRLILARQLRGARRFGPEVLAQLLFRTAARAERVDLAMRLRGASAPAAGRISRRDLPALCAALAAAVALHLVDGSGG